MLVWEEGALELRGRETWVVRTDTGPLCAAAGEDPAGAQQRRTGMSETWKRRWNREDRCIRRDVQPAPLGTRGGGRAVVELLKLDRLLIIPAGLPPHKDLPAGSPTPEQRLEMTRLAADQLGLGDRVEVLDVEIHRHGKSYTADTLAALKARYPDDELWLLMGTDMFLTFQAWHEPERILSLAGIAAFGRTEADTEELFSVQRDYLYRTYPQARLFTLTIPGRGGYLLHGAAGKTRPGRRSKLPGLRRCMDISCGRDCTIPRQI